MKQLKNIINHRGLTSSWPLLFLLAMGNFRPAFIRGEEGKQTVQQRKLVLKKVEKTSIQKLIGPTRQVKKNKASFDLNGFKARYELSRQTTLSKDNDANLRLSLAAELDKRARASGELDPVILEASAWTYKDVIASTIGLPKLRASCNWTAQLLRQGQTKEAISIMEQVNPMLMDTSLSAQARSRSLYNYGRALNMDNRPSDAYRVLKQAVDLDPTFRKAAQMAGEAALMYPEPSSGILAMAGLISEQLAHLNYQGAADNLRAAINKAPWIGNANYPRLIGQLTHYLALAEIDSEAFERDWLNDLVAIEPRLDRTSRAMIRDLRRIYAGRIRIQLSPEQVRAQYRVWNGTADDVDRSSGYACLSDFLYMVGNSDYRQENLGRAMACYGHAWALNSRNMEAGLYLANILLLAQERDHKILDPEGQILESFIDQLFLGKGNEYRRDVGTDWEKILKCHVILARIFERQKKWGPPHNSCTALFQWTLASHALERLSQTVSPEDKVRFGRLVELGMKRAARQWNAQ